jgi:hypothetical protein
MLFAQIKGEAMTPPKTDRMEKVRTYEDWIKRYFPKDWKNRQKICIHCHQEIKQTHKNIDEMGVRG